MHMHPDTEMMRSFEVREARNLRGECSFCGHTWRPRNPSIVQKRCPACQHRGKAQIKVVDISKMNDPIPGQRPSERE